MTIARRVETLRERLGVDVKEIAAELWPKQREPWYSWYKKVNLRESQFDNAELSRIADFFSRRSGRSLIGWPYIDEHLADQLERGGRP